MIRWLLLGYGDLADKRVVSALQDAKNSELVAVWGRDAQRAKDFAERHNIPEALNGDEALDKAVVRDDIDAVYVCTPVYSHFEYASYALANGKHVLCEKPLGMDWGECADLVELAEDGGKKLGVAYYRRCYTKHKYIRKIVRSGELGDGVLVSMEHYCRYCPDKDDPKYWRVVPEKSGGGVSFDVGSHRLDLLSYWFGHVKTVYAEAANKVRNYPAEDTATFLLRFARFNDANGVVCFSWAAGCYLDRLEIVGTEGKIIADPLDGKELVIVRGRDVEVKEFELPENVHLPLVEDFIEAIENDRKPICSGKSAAKVNAILEKLDRKL